MFLILISFVQEILIVEFWLLLYTILLWMLYSWCNRFIP